MSTSGHGCGTETAKTPRSPRITRMEIHGRDKAQKAQKLGLF
jgi:hypothetical protein